MGISQAPADEIDKLRLILNLLAEFGHDPQYTLQDLRLVFVFRWSIEIQKLKAGADRIVDQRIYRAEMLVNESFRYPGVSRNVGRAERICTALRHGSKYRALQTFFPCLAIPFANARTRFWYVEHVPPGHAFPIQK